MRKITQSNIEKFIAKIKISNNGCWEWQGYTDRLGYGRFHCSETKKQILAHRWIYQHIYKKILPIEILVCHSCDNPPCCNPSHLWEGTNEDNIRDMISKGRQKGLAGNLFKNKGRHKAAP